MSNRNYRSIWYRAEALGQLVLTGALLAGCAGANAPTDGSTSPDAERRDGAPADGSASTDAAPIDAPLDGPPCNTFRTAVEPGVIESAELDELSGLVASRASADVLFGHNDSGDTARVFALDTSGRALTELRLRGATQRDWEDIAISTDDAGRDVIWVGDIGDNAARSGTGSPRSSVEVLRFVAPAIDASAGLVASIDIDTFDRLTFTFPDAPHDSESLFIDPGTGDLYLFAKENIGPATLYRARAPLTDGETRELEAVAVIDPNGSITGADVRPEELVVRTYSGMLYFRRTASETWADVVAGTPVRLSRPLEVQGESIAFAADGSAIFSASEGAGAALHRMDRCP